MARTVVIAQRKGGAGKSTLAAHLAVAWARGGLRVALVDVDPQASLSHWHDARATRPGLPPLAFEALSGWRATTAIERLGAGADRIVVDTPPHADTDARLAVRAADLVLVPFQPSALDLWATEATLALAASERRPALVVVNRVPARAAMTGTILDRLAALGAPVATARLGARVAFAAAMAEGLTVADRAGGAATGGAAAAELTALVEEIDRLLERGGGR